MGDVLEQFVHHLRAEDFKERTVTIYAYVAGMYLESLSIHGLTLADATRESVGRYLQWLKGRGLTSGTLRNYQGVIRRLHEFAGEPDQNPLAKPYRYRRGEVLPRAVSEEHVTKLLESVAGDDPVSLRDRAILELLYSTGIRASELLGIRLDDLSLEHATARIDGKGGREAVVAFGEQAKTAIARYLERARPGMIWRGEHGRLWVNCFGGALRYGGLLRITTGRAKAAGLAPMSPHQLRHSFATHLMDRGAHIRIIQELLRHRSVATTQIYTHLDTRRLADERRRYHPRG